MPQWNQLDFLGAGAGVSGTFARLNIIWLNCCASRPGSEGRGTHFVSGVWMLASLSTRRYPVGLEPVGSEVEATATGTSKSAVSRRFVARTSSISRQCISGGVAHLQ